MTGEFEFRRNVWGYNVMTCSTCAETFCPKPTPEKIENCDYECKGGVSFNDFCNEDGECLASRNFDAETCKNCRNECVQSCLCPDTCVPVIKDAASCVLSKGRWEPAKQGMSFDNLYQAFFTLFQIITTEGWVAIMLACICSRRKLASWGWGNAELVRNKALSGGSQPAIN